MATILNYLSVPEQRNGLVRRIITLGIFATVLIPGFLLLSTVVTMTTVQQSHDGSRIDSRYLPSNAANSTLSAQ